MKKVIFAVILLILLSLNVSADYYEDLYSAANDSVRENISLSELDNAQALVEHLSPQKIMQYIQESFVKSFPTVRELAASLVSTIVFSLICNCVSGKSVPSYLSVAMSAVIVVLIHNSVYPILANAFSSLVSVNGFITLVFSFMSAGLAAGGKTITATALPTACASIIGLLSQFNSIFMIPMINVLLCVSYASAIENGILPKICNSAKNALLSIIGMTCFVFTTVTALQKNISVASDGIGTSALRLAVSGSMPVIGSTVKDAFGTVVSSSKVIVSTAGVFGIIALLIMLLPGLVKLLLSLTAVKLAVAVGGSVADSGTAIVLKGVEGVFEITAAIYGCEVMYTIVSVGIMISSAG